MSSAFSSGESHVLSCVLCYGKGFICEVCKDPRPVYPFHLEAISQCAKCWNVFHRECGRTLASCPRCDRKEARELNWHVGNARIQREARVSEI